MISATFRCWPSASCNAIQPTSRITRPAPTALHLELQLRGEEHDLIEGLIATGVYGNTPAEAVRAAFMRWCNQNVTRVRRAFVEFTD